MVENRNNKSCVNSENRGARAEGPWSDLALYSIGWKAFQDLCSQVCEEVLRRPVEIYREAQDDGQDAVFLILSQGNVDNLIGSVQCKHSSDPKRRLQIGDLTPELRHVTELVQAAQAHTYILMTSMSVDAHVARSLRDRLRQLGVRKPYILGKQYLIRAIRANSRLRALVPQVYGLGDLSTILDQRLLHQTRALLNHWIPKLKFYVPTDAHRLAIKALNERGVVLLLGNPSTGKSTIGAILSTIATEDLNHTVLNLTSPRDFDQGWNPHDPGRFFWIDDAFGSNVVREEYVQDWTSTFRKVQAAIASENRFLFTSRRHIYEADKLKLAGRNLAVFSNGQAVVDVGSLKSSEKMQILYNHINFGGQTQSWKRSVKPHLSAVAEVAEFLPGIAERLGDPAFTKALGITRDELIRFMEEPREHLIDTINALEESLRAALVLVYVHQGTLSDNDLNTESAKLVTDLTGVPLLRIHNALGELKGSFVRVAIVNGSNLWSFVHPTIADALTDILKERPNLMAALLRGASVETILTNFFCEGTRSVKDAPIIPSTLDDILVSRLAHVRDEPSLNWLLFRFLAEHVSDSIFERVVNGNPDVLRRKSWLTHRAINNPKILSHARAFRLGCLDEDLQNETAEYLEATASRDFDLSFFEREDVLRLVPPTRLMVLGMELHTNTLVNIPDSISSIADEADLDESPDSHFELYTNSLDKLEEMPNLSEATIELIQDARGTIDHAIHDIERRKEEQEEKNSNVDWDYMSSVPAEQTIQVTEEGKRTARSIFDDVDL